MAEIIDITAELNKRAEKRLIDIKEELEIELERLDFDIEKELNRFVIFDTSMYYNLVQDDVDDKLTVEKTINFLLTAADMLVKLDKPCAALELKNIITRLENDSYEEQ